jgi:hypothetical protein
MLVQVFASKLLLICCKTLEYLRAPTINNIIEESSKLFASHCTNPQLDIIQLIINPFHYAVNNSLEASLVGILLISFWLTVFVLASGWIFPISYVGERYFRVEFTCYKL